MRRLLLTSWKTSPEPAGIAAPQPGATVRPVATFDSSTKIKGYGTQCTAPRPQAAPGPLPLTLTVDRTVDWAVAVALLSFLLTVMLTAIDWEIGLSETWLVIRSTALLVAVCAAGTLAVWWNLDRSYRRR